MIHFIFFVTYARSNKLVLHNTRLERLVREKHSSLFGLFGSYEENEVFIIWPDILLLAALQMLAPYSMIIVPIYNVLSPIL